MSFDQVQCSVCGERVEPFEIQYHNTYQCKKQTEHIAQEKELVGIAEAKSFTGREATRAVRKAKGIPSFSSTLFRKSKPQN